MSDKLSSSHRDVYIVDGARTPFLKSKGQQGPFAAADLAVNACRQILIRNNCSAENLDEVIAGCIMPSEDEINIARLIALRLGCGNKVPAWTVQRNCASAMQAIDSALTNIRSGRSDLVLAGGTEAMSRAPLLFNTHMSNWLGRWMGARSFTQRLQVLSQLRPNFFSPVIALMKGLTDPLVGLSMGQTAENLAYRFNISREQMDAFAARSHKRTMDAIKSGYLDEVIALYDAKGKALVQDDGVREDSTEDKLAKLKPFFDKKFGAVTAGNSSQITDGAAFLLLASADAVKKYNLPVLAKITDVEWAGLDPAQMGLGPVHAATPILQRHKLDLQDIDCWEINEAFAAQVIACVEAWKCESYCKNELGLSGPLGTLDENKLNIDGGAIALGHPVGASGARIVLHLAKTLKRLKKKQGMAAICIGGGQGGAMLIENVDGVQ